MNHCVPVTVRKEFQKLLPAEALRKGCHSSNGPLKDQTNDNGLRWGAHHGPPRSKSHPGVSKPKSMKYWLFDKDPFNGLLSYWVAQSPIYPKQLGPSTGLGDMLMSGVGGRS